MVTMNSSFLLRKQFLGHPGCVSNYLRFRSFNDFAPHYIWLLRVNDGFTNDYAECHCQYCPKYIEMNKMIFLELTLPKRGLINATLFPNFQQIVFRKREIVWVPVRISGAIVRNGVDYVQELEKRKQISKNLHSDEFLKKFSNEDLLREVFYWPAIIMDRFADGVINNHSHSITYNVKLLRDPSSWDLEQKYILPYLSFPSKGEVTVHAGVSQGIQRQLFNGIADAEVNANMFSPFGPFDAKVYEKHDYVNQYSDFHKDVMNCTHYTGIYLGSEVIMLGDFARLSSRGNLNFGQKILKICAILELEENGVKSLFVIGAIFQQITKYMVNLNGPSENFYTHYPHSSWSSMLKSDSTDIILPAWQCHTASHLYGIKKPDFSSLHKIKVDELKGRYYPIRLNCEKYCSQTAYDSLLDFEIYSSSVSEIFKNQNRNKLRDVQRFIPRNQINYSNWLSLGFKATDETFHFDDRDIIDEIQESKMLEHSGNLRSLVLFTRKAKSASEKGVSDLVAQESSSDSENTLPIKKLITPKAKKRLLYSSSSSETEELSTINCPERNCLWQFQSFDKVEMHLSQHHDYGRRQIETVLKSLQSKHSDGTRGLKKSKTNSNKVDWLDARSCPEADCDGKQLFEYYKPLLVANFFKADDLKRHLIEKHEKGVKSNISHDNQLELISPTSEVLKYKNDIIVKYNYLLEVDLLDLNSMVYRNFENFFLRIRDQKFSHHFLNPVDQKELAYYNVIENPMDLMQLSFNLNIDTSVYRTGKLHYFPHTKKKIKYKTLRNLTEIFLDFIQIFLNCFKFNTKFEEIIYQDGLTFFFWFRKEFTNFLNDNVKFHPLLFQNTVNDVISDNDDEEVEVEEISGFVKPLLHVEKGNNIINEKSLCVSPCSTFHESTEEDDVNILEIENKTITRSNSFSQVREFFKEISVNKTRKKFDEEIILQLLNHNNNKLYLNFEETLKALPLENSVLFSENDLYSTLQNESQILAKQSEEVAVDGKNNIDKNFDKFSSSKVVGDKAVVDNEVRKKSDEIDATFDSEIMKEPSPHYSTVKNHSKTNTLIKDIAPFNANSSSSRAASLNSFENVKKDRIFIKEKNNTVGSHLNISTNSPIDSNVSFIKSKIFIKEKKVSSASNENDEKFQSGKITLSSGQKALDLPKTAENSPKRMENEIFLINDKNFTTQNGPIIEAGNDIQNSTQDKLSCNLASNSLDEKHAVSKILLPKEVPENVMVFEFHYDGDIGYSITLAIGYGGIISEGNVKKWTRSCPYAARLKSFQKNFKFVTFYEAKLRKSLSLNKVFNIEGKFSNKDENLIKLLNLKFEKIYKSTFIFQTFKFDNAKEESQFLKLKNILNSRVALVKIGEEFHGFLYFLVEEKRLFGLYGTFGGKKMLFDSVSLYA
ncbi:hypothetical protein HK099_003731 [Clydaea vesicula]|uniref:Bromo domain-containing protein n=1 Tax=Clydaea vesicula TaxID=447962 RepID=A0AAD5U4I7_9FUNG|nr:hypothetical protein HK099_003731 [Clydaea vesicula]